MPEIGAKLFDTPLHYLVFFIHILKPDDMRAEASCDVIFYKNFVILDSMDDVLWNVFEQQSYEFTGSNLRIT